MALVDEFLTQGALGPVAGVVAAVLLVVGARRGWPRWLVGAVAVAPVAWSAFFAQGFNRVGWHGLMHYAHTVQVLRQVPPEDPLLAGHPLLYPVAYDWLFGALLRWLDLPLLSGLIRLDVGLALLTLWLLDRVARRGGLGRAGRDAVVVLGFWGVAWGLAWWPGFHLAQALNMVVDHRPLPLDKFANPNSNQVGYLLFVAFAWASLEVLEGAPRRGRWLALLGASALAAAFLYPLAWGLAGVGLGLGGAAAWAVTRSRELLRRWLMALGVAGVASLPALPYLRFFSHGKSDRASFHLVADLADLGTRLPTLALWGLGVAALLLARRRTVAAALAQRPVTVAWALAVTGGFASAYLVARGPGWGEYKLLLFGTVPAALLVGVAVEGWAERSWRGAASWGAMLALSAACAVQTMAFRFTITPAVEVASRGFTLTSPRAGNEAVYAYLRERTPGDAVVVTVDSLVPALGQRSLYVGHDVPRANRFDGWGVPLSVLMRATAGHPDAVVDARLAASLALVGGGSAMPLDQALAQARRELGNRPLYVLTFEEAMVPRLLALGTFRVVLAQGRAVLLEATDLFGR